MRLDKTTLVDLSFFPADGSGGIFGLIDRTTTQMGRDRLRKQLQQPCLNYEQLLAQQACIKFWVAHTSLWPANITNGTLVMLQQYYDTADSQHRPPNRLATTLTGILQKVWNKDAYFSIKFNLKHLQDLFAGCKAIVKASEQPQAPEALAAYAQNIASELQHPLITLILGIDQHTPYSLLTKYNYEARRTLKSIVLRLMDIYARLDAQYALAQATIAHQWTFPELLPEQPLCYEVEQLYHPLLQAPIAYNLHFNQDSHFLLLTGANMSGKTTYMRALGVGALLAHMGMGTPAKAMKISFLHGIITNMQVEDNLQKGESFFMGEVQRMKQTAQKLLENKPHLVLMDELFKGTNVHDAYECTKAVVDGLIMRQNHLMILSTHLYEVAHQLAHYPHIKFGYFVTDIAPNHTYTFTYQLKEGISNDRIGYLILMQEGVISLLHHKNPELPHQ